ncbi:MAG: DNA-directed RNA polymerase subunit omega [Lachnospiraceae bacterium]|nr:DNA-directed RNA polymerase subunit omega [Lachnospiraceae bacterium]MDN4743553.1 DNA-directed RNA polymerase subunit omega [Lachnospiraceae bacterium C1.1]
MLHPSYADLMEVVNSDAGEGEAPIVSSRYSIVLATSKRARQLSDGATPLLMPNGRKPLSLAVDELWKGKIHILNKDENEE